MILWYILLTPIKGNLFWGFDSIVAEDFICVCVCVCVSVSVCNLIPAVWGNVVSLPLEVSRS
jgi:hypothetical protein